MDIHKKESEKEEPAEPVKQIREILQASLSQSPPDSLDGLIHKGEIATQLLSTIPVSRSAALETIASCYLAALRDTSKELDNLKRFLFTTSDVIQSLLEHNKTAWSPVIFHWGLSLLVKMSIQDTRRSSTQEQIKYWISNQVVRPVLNLTFNCIDHFYTENPEKCIRQLLEQTKDSNKTCNWICCHLSMSYIDTSIPIVFKLIENNKSNEYTNPLIQSLEYVSIQAPDSVRNTILTSFSAVLEMTGEPQREMFKFYHELASQSTILLNLVALGIIKLLTVNRLRAILSQERDAQVCTLDDTDQLNRFLHEVVLFLRGESVYALIECLLHTSYPERSEGQRESQEVGEDGMEEGELREESPEVWRMAERLLEYMLIEMENNARRHVLNRDKMAKLSGSSEKHNTYLFVVDLSQHTDRLLLKYCKQRNENKLLKALSRLLVVIGLFCSDSIAIRILVHCILHAPSDNILLQIPQLQEKLSLMHPLVMVESFKRCLTLQQQMGEDERKATNLFKNISILLKMEAGAVWKSVTSQIHDELLNSVLTICEQLSPSQYTHTFNILDFIEKFQLLPMKARLVKKINVCMHLLTLFFGLLERSVSACFEGELDVHCELCLVRTRDILGDYCSNDRQCLVFSLRKIVYMCAVSDSPYHHLITGDIQTIEAKVEVISNETSLLVRRMNEFSVQNDNSCNTLKINNHIEGREFVHKQKSVTNATKSSQKTQRAINQANEQIILLLARCCLIETHSRIPHRSDSYNPLSMQQLGQIVLDTVAASEVPGNRDWFDEETLKYNIERHLKIRASLEETHLNLELLLFLANDGVALITCYPIIRAMVYVLVNFWSLSKAVKGTDCPIELNLSLYLIRVLCRAQWLNSQMLCLMEMFEILPANEIRQLMEEVQDFLKKNPPDKEEYKLRDNNIIVREYGAVCMQQFYELINIVVIRNIESVGHLVGALGLSNKITQQ
ncbi:Integrator complex subunit 5 [Oopsacas minuta]|uniref:Integrator complex subunit 5 n=1 Tax=Oopsacas minuta TaxID=111878 RepID=A0AAV7K2Z7_9METZ|nr:Integrator complex subunit 5 [Oopsacas minuta]